MPASPVRRALNAFSRLAAGLPARGVVSPEVPDDLFQAHLAFYLFAARYAGGRRVLDLGCGTGYGAARLVASGATSGAPAASVVGLDPDERLIGYARKRFAGPSVRFVVARAEALPGDLGLFDTVVAANVLPHLEKPAVAIEQASRHLQPEGALVASVPPIADDRTMEAHRAAGTERSSLYLWDWETELKRRFGELTLFRLEAPPGATIDLSDSSPSRLAAADFRTEEIPLARAREAGSLAAIFVATRPRL
ncbi:MAG TPA: class I SAM-dependent methyltransferase [Thermoanaerobaculia bacterium]|jgi:SAM-dependent methyltransferase|nr:class I SAM-dependent methyltransferase [Thermoanaerobaculia bacterium]